MSTKKNIYIHIGNHKTGTSSLQYFLKKKKNVFLRLNYHYAVEKKAINHHNISWQAIKHFYYDKNKQTIDALLQEIYTNKSYNILISSENFENLKYGDTISRFMIIPEKTGELLCYLFETILPNTFGLITIMIFIYIKNKTVFKIYITFIILIIFLV